MKSDFGAAMRQALKLMRAQNVMEATRVIQRALAGLGAALAGDSRARTRADPPAPAENFRGRRSRRRSPSKQERERRRNAPRRPSGPRGVRLARS